MERAGAPAGSQIRLEPFQEPAGVLATPRARLASRARARVGRKSIAGAHSERIEPAPTAVRPGTRLQADPAAPDTTIIEKCALRDSQPEGCGMTFITFLVTLDTMWDDDPHPAFVSIGTNRDSLLGFPLAVPGRCRGTETGVPVSPRQNGPVPNRVEAK